MIDRRHVMLGGVAGLATAALPWSGRLRAADPLKVAALKFGSLNWLLETIKAQKLDEAAGVAFDVLEVATNQAGPIALLSGDADIIVSDWTWAMRQRGLGQKVLFRPYSSTLGSIMVAKDGPIRALKDMEGKRLGVAGSAIDKSWLILRAYSRSLLGRDVADFATPAFGAAPLIAEELRNGRVDACLNFWTYSAKLEGAGFRPLLSVDEMLQKLGIEPVPPLVGFVWREDTSRAEDIAKFLKAVDAGNELLKTSDAAFDQIRPLTRAKSDAEFFALKAYYRSGIPKAWSEAHTEAARKLFELFLKQGGQELVGNTTFDAKLFDGTRDR